jgi:hypothetical protein
MELDERSIIIDDHLNRIAEAGMERYFTHAYCTAGECGLTYNGERFTIAKGDCVIIIANQLVTAVLRAIK